MFKFSLQVQNGDIVDIRLIDFQLSCISSVVTDLCYLLYAGTKKEIFNKLPYYLKIYHNKFSDTLKSFNLDASEIFTIDDLEREWKEHSAYGLILSQLVWPSKLSKVYETRSLVELEEMDEKVYSADENEAKALSEKYQLDVEQLMQISLDLVQHFYDNDSL